MSTLAGFTVLAILTAQAVHRDIQRAVRRRRLRQLLEPIRHDFERFRLAIVEQMMPSLAQAAQAMAALGEALRKAGVTMPKEPTR